MIRDFENLRKRIFNIKSSNDFREASLQIFNYQFDNNIVYKANNSKYFENARPWNGFNIFFNHNIQGFLSPDTVNTWAVGNIVEY